MGDEQSLNPEDWDREQAIDRLEELKGQSLIEPQLGYCIYSQFRDREKGTWADEVIQELQYPASEELGLIGTPAFKMVVAVHDLSAAIVEELDSEPGSSNMAGRGFAADDAHKQNVQTIKEQMSAQA